MGFILRLIATGLLCEALVVEMIARRNVNQAAINAVIAVILFGISLLPRNVWGSLFTTTGKGAGAAFSSATSGAKTIAPHLSAGARVASKWGGGVIGACFRWILARPMFSCGVAAFAAAMGYFLYAFAHEDLRPFHIGLFLLGLAINFFLISEDKWGTVVEFLTTHWKMTWVVVSVALGVLAYIHGWEKGLVIAVISGILVGITIAGYWQRIGTMVFAVASGKYGNDVRLLIFAIVACGAGLFFITQGEHDAARVLMLGAVSSFVVASLIFVKNRLVK